MSLSQAEFLIVECLTVRPPKGRMRYKKSDKTGMLHIVPFNKKRVGFCFGARRIALNYLLVKQHLPPFPLLLCVRC